jgi:hypothetical protein
LAHNVLIVDLGAARYVESDANWHGLSMKSGKTLTPAGWRYILLGMKWIVEGANPETGTELQREIEAESFADAEQAARNRGLLISGIRPASTTCDNCGKPYGRLETPIGLGNNFVCIECFGRLREWSKITQPTEPTIAELSLGLRQRNHYFGLRVSAGLAIVAGFLCYIGAIILVARAFSDARSPIEPWETYPGIRQSSVDSTPLKVGAGVLIFIGGAVLHVVGFGALAVRDIAKE